LNDLLAGGLDDKVSVVAMNTPLGLPVGPRSESPAEAWLMRIAIY